MRKSSEESITWFNRHSGMMEEVKLLRNVESDEKHDLAWRGTEVIDILLSSRKDLLMKGVIVAKNCSVCCNKLKCEVFESGQDW